MATRRSFVAGLLAAGLMPKPSWADVGDPLYLAAGMLTGGRYVLCGLRDDGSISFELPLPARGHAAAAHPTKPEAVAFARRPGTFAIVLDCTNGREKARLHTPANRHFYGHGVFAPDGGLLFTTENDYENARGIVGVWDVKNGYRRVGEFWSGGIGPHDIKLLPDRRTLVIANGGIETHPETGRTKLNIPTMLPNLCYLRLDGSVLERVTLGAEFRKNSIRHLAVGSDNLVAFAMQWQGDLNDHPPVLGLHRQGSRPMLALASPNANRNMLGYAGSVAISTRDGTVAVTSPRGGMIQVFDIRFRSLKFQYALADASGIAEGPGGFLASSGTGKMLIDLAKGSTQGVEHPVHWDNHLIPIGNA